MVFEPKRSPKKESGCGQLQKSMEEIMKRNYPLLFIFCLIGVGIFFSCADSQALMRKATLSDLINKAGHICYGQVVDLKSEWDENMTSISTIVRLSVFERLKGSAASGSLSFKVEGGVVGEIGQKNSNSPLFWPNERVIVFIDPQYRLVDEFQGKFQVRDGVVVERGLLLSAFLTEIKDILCGKGEGNFFPRAAERLWPVDSARSDYSISPYRWCQENPMGEDFYFHLRTTENYRAACLEAALTWNSSGACFQFSYGGLTQISGTVFDGVNVIYWDSQLPDQTLAQTTYWFNASTGCMLEVDCGFNDRLAWSTNGEESAYDVQTCMLHEFGHYLSLDHSQDPAAIMYPYYSGIKRSLSDDDKAGIIRMYGRCEPGEEEPTWEYVYQFSLVSPDNLALLREYRDQVLRRYPNGNEQIKRLYSQSHELMRVLISNPRLIIQARQLIEKNLPEIQKVVNHQEAVLQDQEAVYAFLDSLASASGSGSYIRMRVWLNGLKRELRLCQRTGGKFYGLRVRRLGARHRS